MTPMKPNRPQTHRKLATVAALGAVASIALLSAAALVASLLPQKPSTDGAPPSVSTNPPVTASPEESPVPPSTDQSTAASAYEALIGYLQEEILSLKEEAFITKSEYQARIEALEKALAAANGSDTPADIPVAGTPDTDASQPQSPTDSTTAFRYTVRDGAVIIQAYTGSNLHVTVPSHFGDLPVTGIGEDAFRASAVKTVVLPETVTEIGWFAFADNPTLQSVVLPASLTAIGYGAFDGTPALTLITPKDSYAEAFAASFGIPHTDS